MAETVKYASDYSPSVVYLNEIVGSKAFLKLASAGGKLPVSVGKDTAEWLKGNGDMLMKFGRSIRRVQCATIPDGVSPCPYGDLTAYALSNSEDA